MALWILDKLMYLEYVRECIFLQGPICFVKFWKWKQISRS